MLFFTIFCFIIFFSNCKKDTIPDPCTVGIDTTIKNNFFCKKDIWYYSLNYDSSFVSLSNFNTDYKKESHKMIFECSSLISGNFLFELENFNNVKSLDTSEVLVKLQTEDLLGELNYDYIIDNSKPFQFDIIELDTSMNLAKGNFAFSMKPINDNSILKPVKICGSSFRVVLE